MNKYKIDIVFVKCFSPYQKEGNEDCFQLIGFDENENAIVNEGTDWVELKLYVPREFKTESYGFWHNQV